VNKWQGLFRFFGIKRKIDEKRRFSRLTFSFCRAKLLFTKKEGRYIL